jgi:hypothetical protein
MQLYVCSNSSRFSKKENCAMLHVPLTPEQSDVVLNRLAQLIVEGNVIVSMERGEDFDQEFEAQFVIGESVSGGILGVFGKRTKVVGFSVKWEADVKEGLIDEANCDARCRFYRLFRGSVVESIGLADASRLRALLLPVFKNALHVRGQELLSQIAA